MSLFLGSIYSTMELDTTKLSGQINGAKRSLTGLGDEADKAGNQGAQSFGSMVKASALGNIAAIGLTTAIGGVTSAARDSFSALTNLQNSRASFEALTGSTEKASAVMKDLAAYAASSPFEFPQIAMATKTLLGFGSSSEQVGGQMRMLGDVAGATGGDLGAIARVFGQVQAAGKLTAEDFNQLIDNGVAVGDMIAKDMNIPMSELRDRMEKGEITFDVFNRAMQAATGEGGKFFGGADKLSQTLTGRISTLKDTFTAMVGTFVGVDFSTGIVKAGGAFDMLSQGIKGATDFMSANKGTIEAIAATVGGGLLSAIIAVGSAFGAAIGFISSWVGAFREGNPLVQGLTVFIGALAVGVAGYLIYLKAVTVAQKLWTAATVAFGIAQKIALIGPVGLVIAAIAGLIAIGFLIVKNWDTIKAAAVSVLGGAWSAIKDGLTGVKNFFVSVWDSIAGFFKQYGVVILAVVAPIIGIPLLIYQNWGTITAFFAQVWTNIKTAFSAGVTAVVGFFQQLPYNIGLAIGTIVRFFVDMATVHIPAFVNGVVTWVSQLPGKISEFFTNMATAALGIATGMIEGVVGFFSALPGRVLAFVTAMWTGYVSIVTALWNWATSTASNIVSGVVGFFQQLPGRIWSAITGMVDKVREVIGNARTALETGARNAIDNTVNFFKELPGKIMGAISGLAGSIGDKFKSIASDAWNGFKKGLGIHSPSYIEKSFMAIQAQGSSTVSDLRHDMADLNRIAATAKRIEPLSYNSNGGTDFNGAPGGGANSNGIVIQNLNLPNVKEPGDFARELKLATVGRGK